MRIESEAVRVRDLRAERWRVRGALLVLWMIAVSLMATSFVDTSLGNTVHCWTPLFLFAGTSVLLGLRRGAALVAGSTQRGSRGVVVLEGGTVQVGSRWLDHVVSGWTEPDLSATGEAVVLLTRSEQEIRFALPRLGMAADVQAAAGIATGQRAVKLRIGHSTSAAERAVMIFGGAVAAILAVGLGLAGVAILFATFASGSLTGWAWGATFGALVLLVGCAAVLIALRCARRLTTTTLSIGSDGVVVERLFLRQLLRRDDIVSFAAARGEVVFRLAGGASVHVPASGAGALAAIDRIEEALAATPGSAASLACLDQGARSVHAWREDLRALGRTQQGYRVAALDREQLHAVVKDGAAPVQRRIAAATALAGSDDAKARSALRIAASTCVDVELRAVLERAAEAELTDEDLERAIDVQRAGAMRTGLR